MIDQAVWEGVESLLDNYAEVRREDVVLVLYTSDSFEAAAWVSACLELRGIEVRRVWMAPIRDSGFADRLSAVLPSTEELRGRLVVLSFERDTMSHTRVLADALSRFDPARCSTLRAISTSPNLFSHALRTLPGDLSARNAAILERLMSARRLRITTRGGTRIDIGLDSKRYRWISNRGAARPGGVVVLPAGEVATFPAYLGGVFVADFAYNVNAVTDRDVRLEEHPVVVTVEDGRATRFECDDPATSDFLDQCFFTYCAYNVGELGFGTNNGVSDAISMNSHINERRPGVHLGFGQHNQDPGVVHYQCAIHLDLIARGGLVWVDEDPTPIDLEKIAPSTRLHPDSSRDEDVFSPDSEELEMNDCCGILTGEGLQLFAAEP